MCERAQKNEDGMKKKNLDLEGHVEAIYAHDLTSIPRSHPMSTGMKLLAQPSLARFESSEQTENAYRLISPAAFGLKSSSLN
jgi:hypothetical protein